MTFFNNQYGQAKIDELKTYIQNNQVKIVHALHIQPTDMPCISIQLLSSDEAEDIQNFHNELPERIDPKVPEVIVPVVTPTAYDLVTGKLNITDVANIGNVCPGMIFIDNSDVEFVIESGNSNVSGNKFINIGKGKTPDLGGDGQIVSSIDFTVTDRRMIRLREVINLGCHAHDKLHLAKFLYYIVYYIIKSRQQVMEDRGLALDRGVASIFDRDGELEGENVYTRYLQLHVLTEFDWDQEQVNLVDCFDVEVKVEENGVKFNTNTSD